MAVVSAVSAPDPLRDLPLKVYSVLGFSAEEAHGLVFCCQPELVPADLFARSRPEKPAVRLLGALTEEIFALVLVTSAMFNPDTGSIIVYTEQFGVLALSPYGALVADTWKAYCVFADNPVTGYEVTFAKVLEVSVMGAVAPALQ